MDKKQMDKLLAKKISEYELFLDMSASKLSAKSLAKQSVYKQITIARDDAYRALWASAIECGQILLDDKESGSLDTLVKGGLGNMNPALLVVHVSGKKADIIAFAKEGLVKQHTAEKAIDRLISNI